MRQEWGSVALVGLLVALAGCADGASAPPANVVPDSIEDVKVTATTGALRGIVVDETITPIPGVSVALAGVKEIKLTANDGGFAFSGLQPGDYFVTATKPGFKAIQSAGTVVAGDANPPLMRIIMAVDNATTPLVELQNWKAFLQCGAWALVVTTNPCAVADSDNVHNFFFGAGQIPDHAQAEAVWEGTQPLGNMLQMGFYDPSSLASNWKTVNGPSPLMVNASMEEIDDALGEDADHTTLRLFPGSTPGTPPTPTVVVNQAYDVYMLYFYNFVPREGYRFAVDGPCSGPAQCG